MTENEYYMMCEMNEKFLRECERVASFMQKADENFAYVTEWRFEDGWVYGRDKEGEHEVDFDGGWLYSDDDEIERFVKGKTE